MNSRRADVDVIARDRARQAIYGRTMRLADDRLPYILPLFSFEKKNKPFVSACGVKVVVGGARFLFTAAHVIDELNGGDLWYADGTGAWSNITGESKRTDPPSGGTRGDDRIDAAVIRLSDPSASRIPGPFLSPRGMDVNDVAESASKYLILGYPSSGTKQDFTTRQVSPQPLRYAGSGVDLERYKQAGVQPFSHVLVDFDRENVLDEAGPTTAPHPAGMSGCGVWRFGSLVSPGAHARDRLIAIFTEYLPKDGRVLVATRVAVHAEILCHHWPEFSQGFPQRRHLRVTVRETRLNSRDHR